jgi:hypothetical protein
MTPSAAMLSHSFRSPDDWQPPNAVLARDVRYRRPELIPVYDVAGSDFFKPYLLDALTLLLPLESEVEFEVIQPRDSRIDALRFQATRKVFVMSPQSIRFRGVAVRHLDGFAMHAAVPLNPALTWRATERKLRGVLLLRQDR